jgi:hypothetical protein
MYKNLSMAALGHSVAFGEACVLAQKHNFVGVELDVEFLRSLGSTETALEWFSATGLRAGGFTLGVPWRGTCS